MTDNHPLFIRSNASIHDTYSLAGGKAAGMARLSQHGFNTPPWIALTKYAFDEFIQINNLQSWINEATSTPHELLESFSTKIEKAFTVASIGPSFIAALEKLLEKENLLGHTLAIRSSGLDEDSPEHSFAGQFSSFLYIEGLTNICDAIKRCWASAYSARGISYRRQHNLTISNLCVGIVIQKMINSEISGVGFSRNPMDPTDRKHLIIDAVLGQCEGLVSGLLEADHYIIDRQTLKYESRIVSKTSALQQNTKGPGLIEVSTPSHQQQEPSLDIKKLEMVARLTLDLETAFGKPQDCEWAFEKGVLFCLQTRPITTLPRDELFDPSINGSTLSLWDNSNIIESYCGVTSPLTFSFAQMAYTQVYKQFCEVIGIPKNVIENHSSTFANMLGLIRGQIYYNLLNWYKLVQLLPGGKANASFMETMLGVKDSLKEELTQILAQTPTSHRFSILARLKLWSLSFYRFLRLPHLVNHFMEHFDAIYNHGQKQNFHYLSLEELAIYYHNLEDNVLKRWQVPIINDCFCMVFFGILKKITTRWIQPEKLASSLPNDLLCGQGDLASAEPTKQLMRIACSIDQDNALREWFINTPIEQTWDLLQSGHHPKLKNEINTYLHHFGFRCVNELKLEELTLHDNPTFVIDTLVSYVKLKNYSIEQMQARERAIVEKAEQIIDQQLYSIKKWIYMWILKHARASIRYRETLRFARTKIFGLVRELFRAAGGHLHTLEILQDPRDIFYLTVDEVLGFIEGRSCTLQLGPLAKLRRAEFDEFKNSLAVPDRLMTRGCTGTYLLNPTLLVACDIGKSLDRVNNDPSKLFGIACSPGVVQGIVRVVRDMKDAQGLKGEILVAERTDPGWVPLYPSCSGLLIERGSLLSHSAVVARELGLPTIVGISGGLMKKLNSGMRVRMDGSSGEIQILGDSTP